MYTQKHSKKLYVTAAAPATRELNKLNRGLGIMELTSYIMCFCIYAFLKTEQFCYNDGSCQLVLVDLHYDVVEDIMFTSALPVHFQIKTFCQCQV